MGKPLFTPKEDAEYKRQIKAIEDERKKNDISTNAWQASWKKAEALHESWKVKKVRKAQERAEEFLNALIILVGKRGAEYVDFDNAFAKSNTKEIKDALAETNTPETRRTLHTILKALTEIPKSWASSAFIRFLRGSGKQKGSTYHGAGTMGPLYGWKENEVHNIVFQITSRGDYSDVLMRYDDVYNEIKETRTEDGYEEVPYGTEFVAVRVERDVEFLNKLCDMLKAQGLADPPAPAEKKAPKPRKVKQFEAGDIIRKATIKDLPLPAHVRIPITKRRWVDNKAEDSEGTIELVITELTGGGYVNALTVKPGTSKAFPTGMGEWTYRHYLEGATFLGKWKGEIVKKTELKLDFNWWPKS